MRNKIKKHKSIKWLLLVTSLTGFLMFQNCSDVSLIPSEVQKVAPASFGGSFCSLPADASGDYVNFIFIIDMSGSNIYKDTVINEGTDVPGLRFDMVESFLDEECLEKYKNKKFTIIGFSDEILNFTQATGCVESALTGDLGKVRSEIQKLRDMQQAVLDQNLPAMDGNNPMAQTYYKKALDCTNSIINDQLFALSEPERKGYTYFTFFLTDGAPSDQNSFNMNITMTNVNEAIDKFNTYFDSAYNKYKQYTSVLAGGGRLQPVLYGFDVLTDVKKSLAQGVLGYMAEKGESFLKTLAEVSDLDLCELLKYGRKQPYGVKKFGVVNLTATMRAGFLYPDSDMDGLTDNLEVSLGFDPGKRRSQVNGNEILDGLCFGLKAKLCTVQQGCGVSNALGINQCDMAAYSLTDGLDSDLDDIPDLVEILKATIPNLNDTLSNNDGDSLNLHEEVAKGRDANYNDEGISDEKTLHYSHRKSVTPMGGCPANQQSWIYRIDHIPLIPVAATSNTMAEDQAIEFLNHKENENIIMVYYIIKKLNNTEESVAHLYGRFYKVDYETRKRTELGQFEELGVINGAF